MSSFHCCFLTCIQVSQEAGKVVWYSHLFQNFPEFIVIHTVKGFAIVNKAEIVCSETLLKQNFLKRWEHQIILPVSWETCMQDKKQQLELDIEQRMFQN